MRSRELYVSVDREVAIEEARREADGATRTIHLVSLQDTLLVIEASAGTIRYLSCCTRDAEVIVTTIGELIDLILPVSGGITELIDRGWGDALD